MQSLATYIHAPAGYLSVHLDDYVLIEDHKKGHSHSIALNPWIEPRDSELKVTYVPVEPISSSGALAVSIILHDSEGDDLYLVDDQPEQQAPDDEIITPGEDPLSIAKIYQAWRFSPQKLIEKEWIKAPKPWNGQQAESKGGKTVYDLYQKIEESILSKNLEESYQYALDKLRFTSVVNQISQKSLSESLKLALDDVANSESGIQICANPENQLVNFPILKDQVHRLRWPSGMGTIRTQPRQTDQFIQGFDITAAKLNDGQWHWIW